MTNEPENMKENVIEGEGSDNKPKKKNIIRLFRPQNSKTGALKTAPKPSTGKKPAEHKAAHAATAEKKAEAAAEQQVKQPAPAAKPAETAEVKAAPAAQKPAAAPKAEAPAAVEKPAAPKTEAPKAEAPAVKEPAKPARTAFTGKTLDSFIKERAKANAPEIKVTREEREAAAAARDAKRQSERNERNASADRRPQNGRPSGDRRPQGGYRGGQGNGQGGYRGGQGNGQGGFNRGGQGNGQGGYRGGQGNGQGGYRGGQGGFNRGGEGKDGDFRNNRGGNRPAGDRPAGGNGRPGSFGGNRGGNRPAAPAMDKPFETRGNDNKRRSNDRKGGFNQDRGDKFDRLEQKNQGGRKGGRSQAKAPIEKPVKVEEKIKSITIPESLTLGELASMMKVPAAQLVKKLFMQGKMVTINDVVEYETAEEIALEYDILCEKEIKVNVLEELLKDQEDAEDTLTARPPVVCVMGHVDHGKTSLLDAIRDTRVTDRESGGITQAIGASVVERDGQKITFLDTPGHEAFTAMRMRGASSTDIAVLVVAADDGVMPQTIEAINHAKAAGIEIIVAINKIDKPSANVERVKQELTEYELISEDWGGSTVFCEVSAKTHEGIDNLLDMILLTADVLELKANANRRARGLVIEAKLDKGRGPVASVLVQKGTLHVGDPIAAGSCFGHVRAMTDDKGRRVTEAGPSTPVEIQGFSDVPGAGEIVVSPETDKDARAFAETFIAEGKQKLIDETKQKMSLDDLFSQIKAGTVKELEIIVKADVQGSVEAVKQSLTKLSNDEVVVKVIHSGVGAINESDVILASASNAVIIGFNVRPDAVAKGTAEHEGVDLRLYSVIYDAINDVEAAMKGMLEPIYEEKVIGHAEIRMTFKASGVGTIAGSYVLDGMIQRGCKARITRGKDQIFDGPVASLKRFKDDVKEVKAGYECGLVFEKFSDVAEGDQVELYAMVEVPRK